MTLHLAPKLDLDDNFVTKTTGILAQRRKGKTYTAKTAREVEIWLLGYDTGARENM